jgi:hypothetical protein
MYLRVFNFNAKSKNKYIKGRWSRTDTSWTSKNASKCKEKGLKYVTKITDGLIRKKHVYMATKDPKSKMFME